MCAFQKQWPNHVVIIFYHTYESIKINLTKLMNEISDLINTENR